MRRRKVRQHAQRHVVAQSQRSALGISADAPATLPFYLQQKNIVRVDVRSDASAGTRVRNHQVVEPHAGNEGKASEQPVRRFQVQVHALNQQAPAGPGQRGQCASIEGAVAQFPAATGRLFDEPRLHTFLPGQREQLAARPAERGRVECAAHQQRLLLPVSTHEAGGRQAAEQGCGISQGHGRLSRCAMIVRCRLKIPALCR